MPYIKNASVFIFCLLMPMLALAQITGQPCALDKMRKITGLAEINSSQSRSKNDSLYQDDGGIYVIPVVFHIIHNGGAENIPDSVIHSQVQVLNEDFGRYGGGANNNPLSIDAGIRFCLASKDPNGKPTTGIVRVQSTATSLYSDYEMVTKNLSRWDQKRYLNIWVVKEIDKDPKQQGYSYYASDMAKIQFSDRDGIVVVYKFVGRNNKYGLQINSRGHTTTHEVGHYLELKHPWGEKENECNEDDDVFDTPICSTLFQAGYNPITHKCNTREECGNQRQVENYMDYSEDRCLNLFTIGQVSRMRNAIKQYRSGLITYANSIATGCQNNYLYFNPIAENKLQILASPATNKVTLYPFFIDEQNAELFIYDALGKLVLHRSLPGLKSDKVELYMPYLQNALYLFVVQTPHKVYTEKIIFLKNRN